MAQNFSTVNELTYIWHDYTKRTKTGKPAEEIYDVPPVSDIWLPSGKTGGQTFSNATIDDLKKFVNILYKRRNWTSYQVAFCRDLVKDEDEEKGEVEENELIEVGKRIYSERTEKIMKPLPTARKIFGYIRPTRMYMGTTEYQETQGRLGYNILLKDYLAVKKQQQQGLI